MIIALIPAYNPSDKIIRLVSELSDANFSEVIIVNDGSSIQYDAIFSEIEKISNVTILRHKVNLGKGAALKTGLKHIQCRFPNLIGVVTIDADGQHLAEDALNIANTLKSHPKDLVLGARAFDKEVPLRNKIGNYATIYFYRLLVGQKLTDTQSGLRGIPLDFISQLLELKSNGYEFELEMLLASKYSGRRIVERRIQTVYFEGNKYSHFRPLIDSIKICYILFRFVLIYLLAIAIDCSIFSIAISLDHSLVTSQVLGRLAAMVVNHSTIRRLSVYSEQKITHIFLRHVALVFVSGWLSYVIIVFMLKNTTIDVITAKVLSELILFVANIAIQQHLILTRNRERDVC